MALLSWGKPKIEKATSAEGAPSPEAWTAIETPKEDSTELIPTAGKEVVATEEGGEVVDIRYGRNTYEFVFDLFVKKGSERPWKDNDGVIDGEHALRLTPEDTTCEGIQIDRCKLRCEERYKSADGILLHYVAKVLKPASGNAVKPYTQA